MTLVKSMLLGVALLIGANMAANAQRQYPTPPQVAANPYEQAYQPYRSDRSNQAYQPYTTDYAPTTPPSWSYDPYTSGFAPSPNRSNGS
jgi:hypothetical protein